MEKASIIYICLYTFICYLFCGNEGALNTTESQANVFIQLKKMTAVCRLSSLVQYRESVNPQ